MQFIGKKSAISLVLTLALLFGAWSCNPSAWVPRVNAVLQELGPALTVFANLLPLLGTNIPQSVTDGVTAWIPRVQTDLNVISQEVQKYQNDVATNATAQAQLNAALATAQTDILSVLPVFRVFDPVTQQRVQNVLNGLVAGVVSVENIINTAEGKTSLKAAPPATRLSASGKSFKNNFNQVVHDNFPTAHGLK